MRPRHLDYFRKYFLVLTLLLSGDIPTNPGPLQNPCIDCCRPVRNNQQALMCDFCDRWVHRKCTEPLVNIKEYHRLGQSSDNFFCHLCITRLPDITDSFFSSSSISDETFSSDCSYIYTNANDSPKFSPLDESQYTEGQNDSAREGDAFSDLRQVREKYRQNVIITYLNVNSFRYKFIELSDMLYEYYQIYVFSRKLN